MSQSKSTLPKAHILVVDDDVRLRKLLERYLREQGYAVSVAEDAMQAKRVLSLFKPTAMVLDVMMPGQTGLEFAAELNDNSNIAELGSDSYVPILMLTAMDTPDDRISGLESGVEDYLTKPFEPRELLLRLGNIIKRNKPAAEVGPVIGFGDFTFNKASHQLEHKTSGTVSLTSAELNILSTLAQRPNEPVSREILVQELDSSNGSQRHVDVQIGRLRKKLGNAEYIQTVRGKGYRLVVLL